ncbi:hypothetical protein AQUCO_01300402v1 [Aquilegia coerulea]|uniref:Uncharacterized protein n=1 Tax=Aquilegia coerulea TaxID=218851 RepID=A0A2G5E1D9_AQUCA|nr:hypothetical protein AQUCO_01300402v1 [Aquilegia coerulea]PIA49585.1 hypothetical protein AQUCO_01300402v1 [Aquilegia coerulea]PIA49591.1 hypothetical protein AQUCO_01300402v1 [Aquilegia coerulea]
MCIWIGEMDGLRIEIEEEKMAPPVSTKVSQGVLGFSLFGNGGGGFFKPATFASSSNEDEKSKANNKDEKIFVSPSVKLQLDKDIYRPGDSVAVTITVHNPANTDDATCSSSFLIEKLSFEIKGLEKLDTQWFATPKPLPGSKQRRGEHVFLDSSTPSIVSNQVVSTGGTKTYIVRTELPEIIPPTYKGTAIRYFYYVRSTLAGRWLVLENGQYRRETMKNLIQLEDRIPLQVWVSHKTSGLLVGEGQSDGILPASTLGMDIYWKEKDADSEWARANESPEEIEEGYESSRDEISSVSSYNPTKGYMDQAQGISLSRQSSAPRFFNRESSYHRGDRSSFSSYVALPQLSVDEFLDDSSGDLRSPKKYPELLSPSQQRRHTTSLSTDDDAGVPSIPRTVDRVASEGFVRGKSYKIRLDDQVLLQFSPKNSDPTYYFGDTIGGTLRFFHEGGRRCLEVAIALEISETIGQRIVHPSRRNSPIITKVQSDHHEVVADLGQTSFLFSIPMEGPMSFSTPHVSVQWALRFEFFTTRKNVDWTRYEHPLLIEGRDKGEWVLPKTVHVPPPGTQTVQTRNKKSFSMGPVWVLN